MAVRYHRRPEPPSEVERNRRKRFDNFMQTYWCSRAAWVADCESATAMYEAEMDEYKEQNPPVLFKNYLIESRGMPR